MGFSQVCSLFAGRWCVHRQWHGELLIVHHHWQHSFWSACSCSKLPIAPMGKCLVDMSIRFSSLMMWVLPRSTSLKYVPSAPETSKFPIAPMGFSHVLRLCLQGGGVFVDSGTVTFSSCTITGNSASWVRAHAQKFPSPRWENVLLTCPFRFSYFMMGAASIYQYGVRAICA